MTSSISFIFWVIKTLSFEVLTQIYHQSNSQTQNMIDGAMFTSGGHLYGQHDLSLNSGEPGIINRKRITQ
jgi:hypothetical protein